MVNTFLFCSDFRKSAKLLDWKRLNKQRTEALQILTVISDLHRFAKLLSYPLPKDPKLWNEWRKTIVRTYQKWDYCYVFYKRLCITVPRKLIEGKVFEKPFREVKFGWAYHTATTMWLAWPEALREYMNAHIEEWIDRGYHNTIPIYKVKPSSYPPWIYDSNFHRNQKAALLAKELDKSTEDWYSQMPDFQEAYKYQRRELRQKYPKVKDLPSYEYSWPYKDYFPEKTEFLPHRCLLNL